MANKEFKTIDEFIRRFKTNRFDYSAEDGWICGIEFSYNKKKYRITKEQSGNNEFTKKLKEKFNKPNGFIEFYYWPVSEDIKVDDLILDIYLGLFDSINDLLDNGNIDGIPLKEILVSEKTKILSID